MHLLETHKHANRTIKVYLDPEPLNPRKDWDNGTVMVHWHPRYDLGDQKIEQLTKEELITLAQEEGDPILAILPLFLFDHSGLSVSTGAYSCRWDSGQVGWVYVNRSKVELMGFPPEYTEEMYEDIIKQDVKSYDAYLTGQVYGYVVEGKDGDELESCWGFVGDKEGCVSEGKSAAEHSTDPAVEREVQDLQSRATYAGIPQEES